MRLTTLRDRVGDVHKDWQEWMDRVNKELDAEERRDTRIFILQLAGLFGAFSAFCFLMSWLT